MSIHKKIIAEKQTAETENPKFKVSNFKELDALEFDLAVEVAKKNAAGLSLNENTGKFHLTNVARGETTIRDLKRAMSVIAKTVAPADELPSWTLGHSTVNDKYWRYAGIGMAREGYRDKFEQFVTKLADLGVNFPGSSKYLSKTV